MMIVQALVTALLAGLFSGVVLFALNERRERTKLMLEKTEAAIEAYSRWTETLSRWPIAHYDMFIGDRDAGRDAAQQIWREARDHYFRAQALIGIYLPERSGAIGTVSEVTVRFMPAHREAASASVQNANLPASFNEAINNFTADFVEASGNGLNELLATARQHAGQQFIVLPVDPPVQALTMRQHLGAVSGATARDLNSTCQQQRRSGALCGSL